MSKQQLTEALASNICKFTYTKKGGGLREAYGTLLSKHLPPLDPSKPKKEVKETVYVTYFDLDAKGFRMLDPSTLVEGSFKIITEEQYNDTIQKA